MVSALLGKKIGMSQIFNKEGQLVPVTVLHVGPCVVTQVRTEKSDGYTAVQLGFEDKRRKLVAKPQIGHAKKADTEPKRFVREVPWDGEGEIGLGQTITAEIFNDVAAVDVIGVSKGKGFQGTMVRHGFKGGPKTHGQSDRPRSPGSIGQSSDPSRVFKGTRMSGHMGNVRTTVQNLKVVEVDAVGNTVAVEGAVPGAPGGYLIIRQALKAKAKAAK